MADDMDRKNDVRFDYIKDKVGYAFPKLVGPKLEKQLALDETRYYK